MLPMPFHKSFDGHMLAPLNELEQIKHARKVKHVKVTITCKCRK